MPSTATAPTATAAQTSAAGSRMLGYYLGGGGVKVECTFDTANFVTKSATGEYVASGGIRTGASNATTGLVSIGATYNGEYLASFGTLRGSGAVAIGFGLMPSAAASDGWVSSMSTGGSWARCGVSFKGTEFRIGFAPAQTAATGTPITLTDTMTLLANGNFGLSVSAPSFRLHAQSSGEIARFDTTTARGSGGGFIGIGDPSGRKGYWGYGGGTDAMYLHNGMNAAVFLGTNNQSRWVIDNVGLLYPVSDNAYSVGVSGNRPSVIYAATGTINTSDAREKTWRGAPTFAELAAARRIAGELGFYQWNDAIADKGEDGARYHFGVRAQAVWAIMADEGLIDPIVEGEPPTCCYGFLCYDEWPEIEAVAEERDEEGNITVAAVEPRAAGNRFGIRPDQLTLFLIAAQEARLAALEAAA